jgi:ribonuclease P protein component
LSRLRRFGAARRLRRARDFSRAFTAGRRSSDECLQVIISPNTLGFARLGMAMNRRHFASAAARNRIRRVVREQFRNDQHRLGSLDIIVVARAGLDTLSASELRQSLGRRLAEAMRPCSS